MTEKVSAEVKLNCAVFGEGSVFPVKIAPDAEVSTLQEVVAGILSTEQRAVPPRLVTLYLARKDDGKWLEDDHDVRKFLQAGKSSAYEEMRPSWKLVDAKYFGEQFQLGVKAVHVLVELPQAAADVAKKQGERSAKDLPTVDPAVQLEVWKSVVRVSSDESSGTALVVDRTATHLYLLTNLHLWIDETFADHLSDEFKTEIKRYSALHPGTNASGKRKKDSGASSEQLIRKYGRTSQRKAPVVSDKPEIVIEQLQASSKMMKEVLKFSLGSEHCWRSSAAFDFAIFKVAAPPDNELVPACSMTIDVHPPMLVHVFGFPGARQDGAVDHPYAIMPAEFTGWRLSQMTLSSLSAPGLSRSGIVCTATGVPIGYIGGGFVGSAKSKQDQSYGFTFHGIPPDLPSRLPPRRWR